MSCSILQAYAGTNLNKVAIDKGYLDPEAFCPANSDDTLMTMPSYSRDEMKGLRRTFAMYVKFPESRWPEIAHAEKLTPEGDAAWAELAAEFSDTFFKTPDTDITRQGNPQADDSADRIREGAVSSMKAS
ncbi:MAG: hypothetical protein HOM07_07030 [Rhodospirillaceae bacterium]|nr:hypothetical protein [Rhodospirillaceae bacterium]